MNEIDWQQAFNALLTLVVAGLGYWFRTEFARMNKRMDTHESRNADGHKELRCDHVSCQQALPGIYVTRRENEITQAAITATLAEIKSDVRNIFEILRERHQ